MVVLPAPDGPTSAVVLPGEATAYLAELGGGCTLPVGALAEWTDHRAWTDADPMGAGRSLRLAGVLASDDGRIVLRHRGEGTDPDLVGRAVARYLLDEAGGGDLGVWTPSGPGSGSVAPSVVP